MLRRLRVRALLAFSSLTLGVACGSSASDSRETADSGGGTDGPPYGGTGAGGSGTNNGAAGSGGGSIPPETEIESSYGSPIATGRYVWVANPTSGRVAFIDAASLQVKIVEAGNAPTHLAAIPGGPDDSAIVINVLSHDATLLHASSAGDLSSVSLPVTASCNSWGVSSDGHFALAWTDATKVAHADPVDGYQDIAVLDLTPGHETSTPLTVGYRPSEVSFDAASARAFVVTQDGIAIVKLDDGTPSVMKNVRLSDDPAAQSASRDVSITPDGAFAVVRRDQAASITVVSLSTGDRLDVPLPAAPTDLDLAPDGINGIAVLRDVGQAALFRVDKLAADPTAFTLLQVGSAQNIVGSAQLPTASSLAFLYSNAVPNSQLTVVDLAGSLIAPRVLPLRAPILGVFPTADAAYAIVLHNGAPAGTSTSYTASISVVPVADDLPPKIQGLPATPTSVAISPDGSRALIAVGTEKEAIWSVYIAQMPSLKIDAYPLASPPIAVGVVPEAGRGYVAQKHPDGRITFFDLVTGEARTLTGFELASQVVYGSGGS